MKVSLPAFNTIADKNIIIEWLNPSFISICVCFVIFTSLVAGSYPALYLSSFRPVNVLKGTFRLGRFASLPRKMLVVIQFTVSIALVIGTVIIYQQIQFSKDRPVGYNRHEMMMVAMRTPEFFGRLDLFKNELKKTGAVAEIAQSSSPVTGIWSNSGGFEWEGKDPAYEADFGIIWVSSDYGKTVEWIIKEGRDFSSAFKSDTAAIILNEAAIEAMNIKDPVGKVVNWNNGKFTIIGVAQNMVMNSPYTPARSSVFFMNTTNANYFNIRLTPGINPHDAVARIEAVFDKLTPSAPFEYKFVDDVYAAKFRKEERVGKLALVFSSLAILISCLGLTGLASFMAEQRTKEIGIRKVLGASLLGIWRLLSRDFVFLVLLSSVIASPLAYYFLSKWLSGFQYHVPLSSGIFFLTAGGALVTTLVTISFQAVKAALMNPVKSLRSE